MSGRMVGRCRVVQVETGLVQVETGLVQVEPEVVHVEPALGVSARNQYIMNCFQTLPSTCFQLAFNLLSTCFQLVWRPYSMAKQVLTALLGGDDRPMRDILVEMFGDGQLGDGDGHGALHSSSLLTSSPHLISSPHLPSPHLSSLHLLIAPPLTSSLFFFLFFLLHTRVNMSAIY